VTETTHNKCDVGSPVSDLQKEYPRIDFSHVDPIWPDKTSPKAIFYEYSRKALLHRAQISLKDLYNRPEGVILVVSHSAFLTKACTGCPFFNADYRIFDWEERATDDDLYRLKEWEETRDRGGGMGWSWKTMMNIGDGLPEEVPPEKT
jgi:broad specificity phosphatase PhoE